MARYLLTHSLMASWLYAIKDNPYEDMTTERDPMSEFIATLNREHTPTTQAMQNGIVFEDLVTAIVNGNQYFGEYEVGDQDFSGGSITVPAPTEKNIWYSAAFKVANIVRGGVLQYRASKTINLQGMELVLYGRLDCLKCGDIYDIKFSKSYERGKYIDSTQHPTYLELVPEAKAFTYIISNGNDVWTEPYRREEVLSIIPTISDFLDWLRMTGYIGTYMEKWGAK